MCVCVHAHLFVGVFVCVCVCAGARARGRTYRSVRLSARCVDGWERCVSVFTCIYASHTQAHHAYRREGDGLGGEGGVKRQSC